MAEDKDMHQLTLQVLRDFVGPLVHASSLEEEARTIELLVEEAEDPAAVMTVLAGLVVTLMDVITISFRYRKPCEYYHDIVTHHEQLLAKYN